MYTLKADRLFSNGKSRNEDLIIITGKSKKEVKENFNKIHGHLFKKSYNYSISKN